MAKCKNCKKKFTPRFNALESWCSPDCGYQLAMKNRNQAVKEEMADMKERAKTFQQWIKDLQTVFNNYIRLRDQDKPCISCQRPLIGTFHAGHYFTVGAYPNLRFHEDNVHGQCIHCNMHNSGNIAEYSLNLPERIGTERHQHLLDNRQQELKLSIPMIKVLVIQYRERIKILKREQE